MRKGCVSSASSLPQRAQRTATHDTSVQVDSGNPPVCAGHEELGERELLDGEDDAVLAPEADHGARVLDGLVGVLDLQNIRVSAFP